MTFIPGQTSENAESASNGSDLNEALEQGDTTFVTGEPKKQVSAGTLGVGGVLVLCAAAVWFMFFRNGPATAAAADDSTADSISQFVGEGKQHAQLMRQMLKNTSKVVQQFQESTARHQIPLAKLSTNPFQMEMAKAKPANESELAMKRRRDEERAAFVENVKAVRLQLIMYGSQQKAAMINDRAVLEGQEVDSMKVEKILPDRIILRSGVYRVEKMLVK
jgi:hypothetical protein